MKLLLWVVAAFVAIQFVPYGHDRTNPPVRREPAWDRPETRALAVRACFDCHSNETKWPAYARIAPASWLVQYDVDEGRAHLNFSEWDAPQPDFDEAPRQILRKAMPPSMYILMHSTADLGDGQFEELAAALQRMAAAQSGR
jgi:hypothetical protein